MARGDLKKNVVHVYVGRFDPLVGRGLVAVLRDDPKLRVIVNEGLTMMPAVPRPPARVVIFDEVTEYSAAARLRSTHPDAGIVVLAHQPTYSYGMFLLAAGATCLPWSVSAEALCDCVHLAAQGGCIYVSSDGDRVERGRKGRIITCREMEVLERVRQGKSPGEIALELKIAPETVRTYEKRLQRKLKLSSTRDLVGIQIPPMLGLNLTIP